MKDKEKIFKLLRESVETPQESFAVEEMIRKVEGIMPPIETVSATQKKFGGLKFYKVVGKNFCCAISIHRFVWTYFNGEIPEGYDVHHRDFNHDNNDIANLELVTKEEHKKFTRQSNRNASPIKNRNSLARSAVESTNPPIVATTPIALLSAKELLNVPALPKLKSARLVAKNSRRARTQNFVRVNVSANISSDRKSRLVPFAAKFFRTP